MLIVLRQSAVSICKQQEYSAKTKLAIRAASHIFAVFECRFCFTNNFRDDFRSSVTSNVFSARARPASQPGSLRKMSKYDLTPTLCKYFDKHMVLSLLEFVEYHHLYAPKDIQEYKLKLLRETKMCDLYAEVYEQLYTKAPSGGLLILVFAFEIF